jgi:hypothetical protein
MRLGFVFDGYQADALIVKKATRLGNNCGTPKQTRPLLSHCNYQISLGQKVLGGKSS